MHERHGDDSSVTNRITNGTAAFGSRALHPARAYASGVGRAPASSRSPVSLVAMNPLVRNNVKVFGHGTQPMLFAHGFGCDQNMWRFVTPAFEADYRIVLFDYVGSGKSDLGAYDAERYATLDGYAQDVLDVVHALDLRDVIFVGHSVSSMVGVLADNRADVRKLQVPSLILQCSEDIIAPTPVGDYLYREMPGSTLRQLRATGHCPHMSHPEETIAAIEDYLRQPAAA